MGVKIIGAATGCARAAAPSPAGRAKFQNPHLKHCYLPSRENLGTHADVTRCSEQQHGLAAIMNEGADWLARVVTEAIRMACIEAGEVKLNKKLCPVEDLSSKIELSMYRSSWIRFPSKFARHSWSCQFGKLLTVQREILHPACQSVSGQQPVKMVSAPPFRTVDPNP